MAIGTFLRRGLNDLTYLLFHSYADTKKKIPDINIIKYIKKIISLFIKL
jgi:hypothetical protein